MIDSGVLYSIAAGCSAVTLLIAVLLALLISKIASGKKRFRAKGIKGIIVFLIATTAAGYCAYYIYHLPDTLYYYGTPWAMVEEIGPSGFMEAVMALSVLIGAAYIYAMVKFYFVKISGDTYKER